MGHPCLLLLFCQSPQGVEQILVSTFQQWAISIKGQVPIPLLRIPPYLANDETLLGIDSPQLAKHFNR